MVLYVALVAIVNLALGYAVAVFLAARPAALALAADDPWDDFDETDDVDYAN